MSGGSGLLGGGLWPFYVWIRFGLRLRGWDCFGCTTLRRCLGGDLEGRLDFDREFRLRGS